MDINKERLLDSIFMLGKIGIDASGERTRLAASDAEKEGRDFVVKQMREAGLDVVVDRIGNIFGIWQTEENRKEAPLMIGSHIDTVINAGQYDGCYGVLTGIEIVRTLKEQKAALKRPLVVGAFTNEEGVRYQPDMMGSLVYAGGLSLDEALDSVGTDGTILRDELTRIGYGGTVDPGFIKPYAFIELHIEQGPIMDAKGISIGAVENLQGISWQRISIEGAATMQERRQRICALTQALPLPKSMSLCGNAALLPAVRPSAPWGPWPLNRTRLTSFLPRLFLRWMCGTRMKKN